MPVQLVNARSREALEILHTQNLLLDSKWFRAIVALPDAPADEVEAFVDDVDRGGDIDFGRSEAALKLIDLYLDEEANPEADSADYPRILIFHEGEQVADRNGGDDFTQRAEISCVFEMRIPTIYLGDTVEKQKWGTTHCRNVLGGIREDLRATGRADRLYADSVPLLGMGIKDRALTANEWIFGGGFLLRAQGT